MNVLAELRSRFRAALSSFAADAEPFVAMVRPAQDTRFGDYQANFAMPLAKQRGENPRQLAADVVAKLDVADLCEPPEVAGPGFINLRLKSDWLAAQAARAVADPKLGVPPVQPRTIVVDYSGPNVAKPMHVGHLRSTVIGEALYRVHKFLGHRVVGDNHVGDWGTQFGMIIYGYKHFLDAAAYERDLVRELARLYRFVNTLCDRAEAAAALPGLHADVDRCRSAFEEAKASTLPPDKKLQDAHRKRVKDLEKACLEAAEEVLAAQKKIDTVENDAALRAAASAHPNILVDTRQETAKLHAGDPENLALWNQFLPACLRAMQGVYDRLEVHIDHTLGESSYNDMLGGVVADLQQKGLARESEGALCVFLEGYEAPFIVRKRDGAYTYATTDLATIRYRVDHFGATAMLYVVDSRQADHFQMLFATARKWGYTDVEFRHVKFGTVLGPDGKPYKTRSGDTVGLESLLEEGVSIARGIVDENSPELDEAARKDVAEVVGIGAIKYADLRNDRESDYKFEWSRMIAMKGDTATYMQYAFARVCGIIRKAGTDRATVRASGAAIEIAKPTERALLAKLVQFPETIDQVAAECRPHFLTAYLFETANAFSSFYNECPVKDAGTPALRVSRLLLCDLTARTLETGLDLLGVKTIERM